MENNEIFENEVRTLLVKLLDANFVDKITHLSMNGHLHYTEHVLLQERYETYQKYFDKISEFMLEKYWDHDVTKITKSLTVEIADLELASQAFELAVESQIKVVRESNTDSALGSILDELETELLSIKFKLGF